MIVSTLISALSLFSLGQGAYALTVAPSTTVSPSTTATVSPVVCDTPSYPPFSLYAIRSDVSGAVSGPYPVRLKVEDTTQPNVTSMVVSTNASCTSCGVVPQYWKLTGQVLSAVLVSPVVGETTINLPVPANSSPSFVTSATSVTKYPIYCAEPRTSFATEKLLAVHGTAELFVMQAWTSIVPYPTLFDIVYDRSNIQPVGVSNFPVHLVMVPMVAIDPPVTATP